jgi:hypothetical protein
MFTLLDPINADLAFTLLSSLGLLLAAATTLAALPWTDAEIASTERAFIALLPSAEQSSQQVRATR